MMTPGRRACSFSSTEDDCRSIFESPCRGGATNRSSNVVPSKESPSPSSWNPFSSQLRDKRRLLLQQTPERKSPASSSSADNGNGTHGAIINPYSLLQIRKDATQHEIRQAYRRRGLLFHPHRSLGTQSASLEEQKEHRQRMFTLLAACCETLLERDSRARLDALLREPRQSLPSPSHNSHTKLTTPRRNTITTTTASSNSNITTAKITQGKRSRRVACHEKVDPSLSLSALSRSFSSYYDDDDDDDYNNSEGGGDGCMDWVTCGETQARNNRGSSDNNNHDQRSRSSHQGRSLTACSTEEMDHVHYTQAETNRLFGGPLSLLYRARSFQAFSDPYLIFNRIFGSSVFPQSPTSSEHTKCITPTKQTSSTLATTTTTTKQQHVLGSTCGGGGGGGGDDLTAPSRSSAWTGSHEILSDGSTVYTTCRVFHHRKLIKREHITMDPITGKIHSTITVTGEDFPDNGAEPNNHGGKSRNCKSQKCMDAEFDPGYWSCCSPMLVFGGGDCCGGGNYHQKRIESVESSSIQINTQQPATTSTGTQSMAAAAPPEPNNCVPGRSKESNSSMPSTYLSRINCAVW